MNDCQVAQSKREKEKAVRANMCTHLSRIGRGSNQRNTASSQIARYAIYISLYGSGGVYNPKHAIFHYAALFEMFIFFTLRATLFAATQLAFAPRPA